MGYDIGDVATLAVQITSDAGVLANAGAVTLTITLPDGTSTGSLTPTNSSTGVYEYDYTPTQVGVHGVRWVATGTNAGAYTDSFVVDAYPPAQIVSLAQLKAALSISSSDSTKDESLREYLAQATDLAERYCNRTLRRKAIVETHDGGRQAVCLYAPPVLSVTSVVEDGVTLSASDYVLNAPAGILYRGSKDSRLTWDDGLQTVVVTYVAGYASPPLVAQRAVIDIARWMFQRTSQGPRPGFGQSADMADYGTDALPTWLFRPLDSLALPGFA